MAHQKIPCSEAEGHIGPVHTLSPDPVNSLSLVAPVELHEDAALVLLLEFLTFDPVPTVSQLDSELVIVIMVDSPEESPMPCVSLD